MKARLLLVIDEMEVGGTQRQMVHLVRGIDRSLFEVEVAFFRYPSFLVDELHATGVRVHEIPKRGVIDLGFVKALRVLVSRGRFDLVHAFSFTSELWSAVVIASLRPVNRPVLVTSIRGTYEWYSETQWRLKRWVSKRSAVVIANTKVGADYAARQMGMNNGRISVVYNGLPAAPAIDSASSVELRKTLGIDLKTFMLLFVGRLVDHKNVETLLQAMATIAATKERDSADGVKRVVLAVAGDGPESSALRKISQSLGLGQNESQTTNVQWLGERRDIAQLMAASDAVVLPSWREGLSNVILEAMQAAKPVLASTAGGNVELVLPEVTGLMFNPADAAGLAAKITQLVEDDSLAFRLGQAGRQRAQESFAIERMIGGTQHHYLEALQRAGKPINASKTTDQAASA